MTIFFQRFVFVATFISMLKQCINVVMIKNFQDTSSSLKKESYQCALAFYILINFYYKPVFYFL